MDLNSPLAVLVPPLLPSRGCMLSCCVLCYIILRIHLLHLFSLNTYKVTALSFQTSFSPQTSGTENEFEVLLLFFFPVEVLENSINSEMYFVTIWFCPFGYVDCQPNMVFKVIRICLSLSFWNKLR